MTGLAGLSILAPESGLAAIWALKAAEYRQLLAIGPVAGIGFLLLAPLFAAASWGCFRRRRWGWGLAVAVIAINALADLARAVAAGAVEGWIGAAIAGALLWWLTRPRVRCLFPV